MRHVTCTRCGRPTGYGTSRVLRKIIFHFCFKCWRLNRPNCEELMQRC